MKLQFSIRDLLLCAAIVVVAVSWLIDHRRLKSQIELLPERMDNKEVELRAINLQVRQAENEAEAQRLDRLYNGRGG